MFDRGLISIGEDFRVLRARGAPDDVARLLRPEARLLLPDDELLRPHPSFLRFHREQVFKGSEAPTAISGHRRSEGPWQRHPHQ
jgi:putative restriction endonuclease